MNSDMIKAAAELFCQRVEAGEVRSVKSYNDFKAALAAEPVPIDMMLFCPACGKQHIDKPDMDPCAAGCMMAKDYGFAAMEGHHCSQGCMYMQEGSPRWTNPPHRTHECQNPHCKHKWTPCATHTTNGVEEVPQGSSASKPPITEKSVRQVWDKIKLNAEFPKIPLEYRQSLLRTPVTPSMWSSEFSAEAKADFAAAASRGAETLRRLKEPPTICLHEVYKQGPRYPLRYGSSATIVCAICNSFRLARPSLNDNWEAGPVEDAVAKAQKVLDDEC